MLTSLSSTLLLLLLAAAGVNCGNDFIDDIKKSLGSGGSGNTGVDLKVGGDSAKIGVRTDDGNPFYYVECSAGISVDNGFGAGCERKWKPLFYGCVAGGAVVAALLLSCCCCCCCAPCRRKRAAATYYPVAHHTSSVLVMQSEPPNAARRPGPPKYDDPMLQA